MIQFNLLPNVKLEYVKAKKTKRITILIATLIGGASLALMVILFVAVQIFQKNYSKDLSKDIKTEISKLNQTEDLNKILTIQNQLNSLTDLHDQKPVVTRIFDFFKQITPTKVSVADVKIDFETQTINITGSADAISTVNIFADTLKFTQFKTGEGKSGYAFNSVVLAGFGRDNKGASYQLSFKFDPVIFSSQPADPSDNSGIRQLSVELIIPENKITSRSETERPGEKTEDLFQPLSNPEIEKQ